MQSMLIDLKNNPVPIGFTYVQLPLEKQSGDIWPWMIWEDVSAKYSGVFFRVVGGEADAFGEIQMANTNRISKVNSVHQIWQIGRKLILEMKHQVTLTPQFHRMDPVNISSRALLMVI